MLEDLADHAGIQVVTTFDVLNGFSHLCEIFCFESGADDEIAAVAPQGVLSR